MLVMTDVVCLVRFAVFVHFIALCTCEIDNDVDYCEKDNDRCDKDGVYKYIGVTSYEEYEIRDRLDDDFELISIRPKLALKKTEKTMEKYPNSPRAILNKALALKSVYTTDEGALPYPEYFSASMDLFSHLVTLPVQKMMVGLLNHVCEMWLGLATSTKDTDTIVKVTTACLRKKTSLGNDLIFGLRATQAINLFLQKEYEAALVSLTSFYAEVADVQQKIGKELTPEPFLEILQLAVSKILHKKVESSTMESLKESFDELRRKTPSVLQIQKDKYDDLVLQGKEKGFTEEAMMFMSEAGVDAGILISKYQRPTEIIPGLRSKAVWDLNDLDNDTVKMIQELKKNWQNILAEGIELKEKESKWMEDKTLLERGSWDQLSFIGKSVDNNGNPSMKTICSIAPTTCSIVTGIPSAFCPTCTSKWSVLGPNSHIGSHCGPTNARLRIHLGLKIPDGCSMRIGETHVTWQEGEVMIFDDSFEHEVWNKSTEDRMIFILDIFHPDLTESQKKEDRFDLVF